MARARNIKPSFFTNEQVSDNCPLGRLLFIGLWTIADFKGDLEWKEKTLKIQLLPWDDCDLKELAINLDKSGLIRFYSDGNKIYINIPNFEKHQNPHKNEKEKGSEIPCYSDAMRQAIDFKGLTINRDKSGLKPESSHSDRADSLLLNPESPILNPVINYPTDSVPTQKIVELFNESFPELPKVKTLTDKRKTALRRRWLENKTLQTVDRWKDFFEYIRKSDFLMGRTPQPWNGFCFDWLINQTNFTKIMEGNYHK